MIAKFSPLEIADDVYSILTNASQLNQLSSSIHYIVSDTAQNISSHFSDLTSLSSIQAINILPDPNVNSQNQTLLNLTEAQLSQGSNLIATMSPNYLLALSQVSANDVLTLQSKAHVIRMQVTDSAKNIAANISKLNALDKFMTIDLTDNAANIGSRVDQINQLKLPFTTHISSSLPDILAQKANLNRLHSTFAVAASSSDVVQNIDAFASLTKVNAVNLTDDVPPATLTFTAAQYLNDKSIINKINRPINVHLTNVSLTNLK